MSQGKSDNEVAQKFWIHGQATPQILIPYREPHSPQRVINSEL